jgi:hypothetical protein
VTDLPDDPTELDDADVPDTDDDGVPIAPDEPSETPAHPTEDEPA